MGEPSSTPSSRRRTTYPKRRNTSHHVRKRKGKGKERQEGHDQVRQGWTPVPRGKGQEVSEERKVRREDRIRCPCLPCPSPPEEFCPTSTPSFCQRRARREPPAPSLRSSKKSVGLRFGGQGRNSRSHFPPPKPSFLPLRV